MSNTYLFFLVSFALGVSVTLSCYITHAIAAKVINEEIINSFDYFSLTAVSMITVIGAILIGVING